MIKIYQSADALSVLFEKGTDPIETHPTRSFSVAPRGSEIHFEFNSGRIRSIPFDQIAKGDGSSAGATIEDVIDYLYSFVNITRSVNSGSTTVRSSFVASKTAQTLSAANPSRLSLVIHNDSTERLFIAYGAGVSNSDFTVRLNKNSTIFINDTTAEITAVSAGQTPTGNILITEITS